VAIELRLREERRGEGIDEKSGFKRREKRKIRGEERRGVERRGEERRKGGE
jgi:hypothetical protein